MDSLVASNIRQRPIRSILSAAGVALGVCLVMLFTGLARGMSDDLQHRSSNLKAEIIFTRSGGSVELTSSTMNLSTKYADELLRVEGVEAALPVIRNIFSDNKGFGLQQIEGVDWQPFSAMNGVRLVAGRAPQADNEVVVDEKKARESKLALGSTIQLFGNAPYQVVGIYSPESGARIKMSLAAMQNAFEAPGKCTYILVKCKPGTDPVEVAKRIDQTLAGNKVQFTKDVFTSIESQIPLLTTFLRVLVVLAAVVSAIVVMLAMYTTITERTREIGILKAMGASRGYIVGVIEKEAVLISIAGLIAGFLISFIAGFLISRTSGLVFEFGLGWAVTSILIGITGSVVGALYPAIRASQLDPVSALTYE